MLAIFTLFPCRRIRLHRVSSPRRICRESSLAADYFMPFFGGILADKFGFGKMVTLGIFIMFAPVMRCHTHRPRFCRSGAHVRRAGAHSLRYGSLQRVTCRCWWGEISTTTPHTRPSVTTHSRFSWPSTSARLFKPPVWPKWITNHFLAQDGLVYNGQIPALAHQYLDDRVRTCLPSLSARQFHSVDAIAFPPPAAV